MSKELIGPMPAPPARITWAMMRAPEFWLFIGLTITGVVAKSKHWPVESLVHEIAVDIMLIIGAISAWLTQKAREAPSPVQEAIIDSKSQLIDSQAKVIEQHQASMTSMSGAVNELSKCVQKNHPGASGSVVIVEAQHDPEGNK